METLARAATRAEKVGEPLPEIYKTFTREGILFRRGGTSMIAGEPGSFKSALALNMLVRWAAEGVTAFYVSADADRFTIMKRCASILSHVPTEIVEQGLRDGKYNDHLRRLNDTRFEWRPLDIHQLKTRLDAFEQVFGSYPDLVVVDTLMASLAGPGDYREQLTMTRDLDSLARAKDIHIMIVHHTSESADAANENRKPRTTPPPRWAVQGKVSQFPRLILTLKKDEGGDLLKIATVKNTNGRDQTDGKLYVEFIVDPNNLRIEEMRYA